MSIQTVEIALPTGIDSVSVGLAEPISIVEVRQGAGGEPGAVGPAGAAGPNTLTTATTTNLSGFISGDGTNISGATAATSTATANTLVLRSAGGGASFAGITLSGVTANSGSYAQIGGLTFNVATTSNANLTTTGSGTVTVSGAGGTTIGGGPLTISASSATFATGSIASSQPLALTQTWTDAAVTYTGLQVNITDSGPSNAASLLMDLRVGGVSYFQVQKDGRLDAGRYGVVGYYGVRAGSQTGNVFAISRSVDGANVFTVSPGGNITGRGLTVTADGVDIGTSSGSKLINDAANTLAQRNGTAQQESRIYGTYTGPGNYRRLALKMSSAGVAQIVAEGGGSGASGNRIEIDGLRIGKGGGNVATNTALGASVLNANTSGSNNSAVGYFALINNTTGGNNSAVAYDALRLNTTGGSNTAVGVSAIRSNTTGSNNSAIGVEALYSNTTGIRNSAVGYWSLRNNTTGGNNSAVGYEALQNNTTGGSNSAIGIRAGRYIADGTTANAITASSVYLGAETKAFANNQTNQIVIGYNAIGLGSNTAVLGNDDIVTTALKGDVGIGTTSPTALLDVNSDTVRVRTARTPASAAAPGNAGDICWDADYIYVCTATDTWKRAAISTW
jgi:hypothetical protein